MMCSVAAARVTRVRGLTSIFQPAARTAQERLASVVLQNSQKYS